VSYSIIISAKAENDIDRLEKSGDKGALKKLLSMLDELARHPTSGTGKPERLKNYTVPTYSRRISGKHWLVYEIHDEEIIIILLSAYGQYTDK